MTAPAPCKHRRFRGLWPFSTVTILTASAFVASCSSTSSSNGSASNADITDAAVADAAVCLVQTPAAVPPGSVITSATTRGSASCASKTLGDVVDAIHAANPALADITKIFDPAAMYADSGQTSVFAFARPDGGFAIAMGRGSGDCALGCTEHEYWYFATDAACAPAMVGHYHPVDDSPKGCVNIDGASMWATPRPFPRTFICGADLTAQNISGTFDVCADGSRVVCNAMLGASPTVRLPSALTLAIAQQPADLAKGTVTLNGTGDPQVDGVAFDATFVRRSFTLHFQSETKSQCVDQQADEQAVDLSYDFDGIVTPSVLTVSEVRTLACADGGDAVDVYCKGSIQANLVVR